MRYKYSIMHIPTGQLLYFHNIQSASIPEEPPFYHFFMEAELQDDPYTRSNTDYYVTNSKKIKFLFTSLKNRLIKYKDYFYLSKDFSNSVKIEEFEIIKEELKNV